MDLKKMNVCLKVIDLGSFTKAANTLGYTPSGITHMMNSLEDEIGFQILIRSKKGILLTDDGKRLVPIMRSILKLEETLDQTIAEINHLDAGTVTIGSYSSIAVHWLPTIIKKFGERYPKIKINIYEGVRQEIIQLLDERKIDIGFISFDEKLPYDWIPLKKDPMVAILPKQHQLSGAKFYDMKHLPKESFIMLAAGKDFDVIELFKSFKVTPSVKYETFENYSAISMVEIGLGMSIMNELITKGRTKNVICIPLKDTPSIELGIISVNIQQTPPAVSKFIECCKENLSVR